LLEQQVDAQRICQIVSDAIKGNGQYQNYVGIVEKRNNDVEDKGINPVAMEHLYEQYPGVPEELLLERE